MTREDAARAEKILWQDHALQIRKSREQEMNARELVDGELKMPFHYEPKVPIFIKTLKMEIVC